MRKITKFLAYFPIKCVNLSQISRNGEDFHFYGFLPKSNTQLEELFKKGFKAKEIASILSELYDLNKNDVYKQVLTICDNVNKT